MFGVFEIDQVSSLKPENPDPVELRIMARIDCFPLHRHRRIFDNQCIGKVQGHSPKGYPEGLPVVLI